MLRRTGSQALHLLMDAAIGVIGLVALAACVFAWRLSQGPIDISALVKREEPLLAGPGTQVSIGSAQLAWEGFRHPRPASGYKAARRTHFGRQWRRACAAAAGARDPLDPAAAARPHRAARHRDRRRQRAVRAAAERGAAAGLGQTEGGSPEAEPKNPGWIVDELTQPARPGENLPWLSQLHRVRVRDASVSIRDQHLGVLWQAGGAEADFLRQPNGGVSGQAS